MSRNKAKSRAEELKIKTIPSVLGESKLAVQADADTYKSERYIKAIQVKQDNFDEIHELMADSNRKTKIRDIKFYASTRKIISFWIVDAEDQFESYFFEGDWIIKVLVDGKHRFLSCNNETFHSIFFKR